MNPQNDISCRERSVRTETSSLNPESSQRNTRAMGSRFIFPDTKIGEKLETVLTQFSRLYTISITRPLYKRGLINIVAG